MGMKKIITTLLLVSYAFRWFSQSDYSMCEGNISVNPNTWYETRFQGKTGKNKSGITYYCNLPIQSNNLIYFHFSPNNNGRLSINTKILKDTLILFIFEVPSSMDCKAIVKRKANLVACERRIANDTLVQNYQIQGKKNYYFVLYSNSKGVIPISFKVNYLALNDKGLPMKDSIMLNLVNDFSLPIYEMHIRNAIDKQPVTALVSFFASSSLDGTYNGSDIMLNNQKKLLANIQISTEGYYPKEIINHTVTPKGQSDTFYLTPITHGSITKLEDIFFAGGLSIILDESMPRLKKLRDFLVLNENISIEIQGHVNDEGANSLSSKKLSKKRAKKIMEYLVQSGVDPERMSAVGMGNTMPVYANPETDEQKEANRRVEIKIK